MCNGGCGAAAPKPSSKVPSAVPALGEVELLLIEYFGSDNRARYGKVTGVRYLFDESKQAWVDARDWAVWGEEDFQEAKADE